MSSEILRSLRLERVLSHSKNATAFPTPVQIALVVGIFGIGWGAMLLGLWCEVLELWDSFRGITLEHSIFRKRIGEQSRL